MKPTTIAAAVVLASTMLSISIAQQIPPVSALAKMPIQEVTVFKDGHAFVLHEGNMPTDANGDIVMDYLPTPVLGTFWPYSRDKSAKLSAVIAGQRIVSLDRTALTLAELLAANPGANVSIHELSSSSAQPDPRYDATIVGVVQRSSEELEKTSPPGTPPQLPVRGSLILLRVAEATKAVALDRIQDVTFKGSYRTAGMSAEFRNLLRLKLEWPGNKPGREADVGLMYVQRGLRWIPAYKIAIDGQGNAFMKLEATLINELADLEDATANLTIGVPAFTMENTLDPIALQQTLAQLGPYFQRDSRMGQPLLNSLMTQNVYAGAPQNTIQPGMRQTTGQPDDLDPEIGGGQRAEDLFVFPVHHVTLKRGQRMVLPVSEFPLKYKDVYTLDIPFSPPPEFLQNVRGDRQQEMAKLAAAPKVMHKLRLNNNSKYPLTTAPGLLVRDNRVLAQGMMFYTPVGSEYDLPVTTAIDVTVNKSDQESNRVHDAATWERQSYARVELSGSIKLSNRKNEAVDLEVTRHVLGNVESAEDGGKIEKLNILEDDSFQSNRPNWWDWNSWPNWWTHFNGVTKITWKLRLEPAAQIELRYKWNYYWH